MKTKALPLILAGSMLAACDVPQTSMNIQNAIFPDFDMNTGACMFDPMSEVSLLNISMDVANQLTLFLVLRVQNTIQPSMHMIDSMPDDEFTYAEHITPVRFDYRWECDAIGFGADLGPMFLPQFSVNQPFCLDERDETTRSFVGFDVITASGGAIAPGSFGGVQIRPVPAQLGIAVFDMFSLAALAQGCCDSPDGCAGVDNGANQACNDLSAAFNDVGIANHLEGALQYRPFSLFDGNTPPTGGPGGTGQPTPSYTMRMRGVLEGVTGSGDLVTSNEWAQDIGFGRNTGVGSVCTNL